MGLLYSRGLYCMCWLYFRACHLTPDITGIASLSITKFYLLWNYANASQPSRWRCLLPQVRSSLSYFAWTIGGLLSEEQNWGWRDDSVVVTSYFRSDEYPVTSLGYHPGILWERTCHAAWRCRRRSSSERYCFLIIPNFVLSIGETPYWVWQEKGIPLSHLFFVLYEFLWKIIIKFLTKKSFQFEKKKNAYCSSSVPELISKHWHQAACNHL